MVELYGGRATGGRVSNVSARARIATGADTLIAGITIETGTTRTVLIRVVGPALVPFGVSGAVSDPQLTLFRGDTRIAGNDDWSRDSGANPAAFAQLGAFAFAHGSKDAALLVNLVAGSYTLHATSAGNTPGIALVELYDVALFYVRHIQSLGRHVFHDGVDVERALKRIFLGNGKA